MKPNTTLLVALMLILLTGASAQDKAPGASGTRRITLQECLRLAVANSPHLKISALEQFRLEESRRETLGGALPHVNFSGTWDDYLNLPTQLIPGEFFGQPGEMIPVQFGTNYNLSAALDASQMLYNQSWITGMRMARLALEQNGLATEKTEIEVVYEVAQSYYTAQITRQQQRNLQSNLEKLEKAGRIARSQWESGIIMKVDVDRIEVQRLNLMTEIDRLEALYLQQMAMQKYFMGLDQSADIALDDSIPTATLTPGAEGDFGTHIDIRMLEKQKELVQGTIRLDQAGYYPNVTLIGATNFLNQSNSFYLFGKPTDWFNTSLVGLRVAVPVFSGMQRHHRVNMSRIELDKLRVREDDTKKLIRINSDDAARKLVISREAEKRQRDNMVLADRVYNVSQEQYQKGVIPLTDLLTSETALSNAQTNHTYALVQMKLAELNYLKANGRLLDVLKP